jgi:diadenosine tetraphosphate (Ap4A) HIT family hydrolase
VAEEAYENVCYARWDKYPVTEGHLLIIPNRHVADYFSVTAEEKRALWAMVDEGKSYWMNPSSPTDTT